MKRKSFLKSLLGIAAVPFVPGIVKAAEPALLPPDIPVVPDPVKVHSSLIRIEEVLSGIGTNTVTLKLEQNNIKCGDLIKIHDNSAIAYVARAWYYGREYTVKSTDGKNLKPVAGKFISYFSSAIGEHS